MQATRLAQKLRMAASVVAAAAAASAAGSKMQETALPPQKADYSGFFCGGKSLRAVSSDSPKCKRSRHGCRHSAAEGICRLLLSTFGSDFCATEKGGVFINAQAWRFNVATESRARFERAPFRGKDISFDGALDGNGPGMDLPANSRVLTDSQSPTGGDGAFDFTVNDQFTSKFDVAFD